MKLTVNGEERRTEARTPGGAVGRRDRPSGDPCGGGSIASRRGTALRRPKHPPPGAQSRRGSRRGFAIALNGEVVRAARWDETDVSEGDRVEIIRAVAGG